MNTDCWIHVFSFLDVGSKMRCEMVSRSFYDMMQISLSQQQSLQTICRKTSHKSQPHDSVPLILVNHASYQSSLNALLTKCPNLKCINFTMTYPCCPDEIIFLITRLCSKLESLHIKCPSMRTWTGSMYEKQMEVACQQVTDKLIHLKHLSLPFCSSERLCHIFQKRRIESMKVCIYNEPLTEDHLMYVSNLLTSLSGTLILTTSAIMKLIKTCPYLQTLSTGPITNDNLSLITSNMSSLEQLSFTMSRGFDVNNCPSFTSFTRLKSLHIQTCSFKHFDGALIKIMREAGRNLTQLTLEGFLITDLSLSFVSLQAPNIQNLRIKRSPFMPVMEVPGITDDAYKTFAKFKYIQSLDIDTPNCITHSGIAYLLSHTASLCLCYVRVWDASKSTISLCVLQHAAHYCRHRVHKDHVFTICLDHPIPSEAEHVAEDDEGEEVFSKIESHRQRYESSADAIRRLLTKFSRNRPVNLHVTARLGSQGIVYH